MFQKIVYDVVLSEQTNYNGEYMLMVRATQQCRYVDIPTNIYVRKYQFKNGLVTDKNKQYEGLNAMIQNIVTDIQATEIEAYRKGVEISPQKIYTIYVEHISTNVSLSEFTEQVLRFCSNRKEITKERYRSCVKAIMCFHKDVTLEDIDLQWLKRYEKYSLDRGCSESTVWSAMKILRTLFNEAIKRDLLKSWQTPFKLYEIPEIRSRVDVLKWDEIEKIHNFVFENRKWNHVRDILCFLCYTGMRVGDFLSLTDDNIKVVGDETWLNFHTSKTGAFVQIPLHLIFYGNALDILSRYKSITDLCKYKDRTGLNRAIANVVKVVGVGGSQHISCHTARRSCITALADFCVNVYTIQKLVGHARITTTQKYMQLSTASIVANLKEAFSKGKSGIIKNKPVLYKDKKGRYFTGDSLVVSCQNCAWLKILIQGKKARPHNYCSIMRKKVRTYDYCSRFKETKV